MIWKVSLLLSLATCVFSDKHAISEQKIERFYPDHHGDLSHIGDHEPEHHEVYASAYPSYEFSYHVDDPHTHDQKAQHEIRDGDKVTGSYWLIQPDGYKRIVKYRSDHKNGFEADVKYVHHGHHHESHEHKEESSPNDHQHNKKREHQHKEVKQHDGPERRRELRHEVKRGHDHHHDLHEHDEIRENKEKHMPQVHRHEIKEHRERHEHNDKHIPLVHPHEIKEDHVKHEHNDKHIPLVHHHEIKDDQVKHELKEKHIPQIHRHEIKEHHEKHEHKEERQPVVHRHQIKEHEVKRKNQEELKKSHHHDSHDRGHDEREHSRDLRRGGDEHHGEQFWRGTYGREKEIGDHKDDHHARHGNDENWSWRKGHNEEHWKHGVLVGWSEGIGRYERHHHKDEYKRGRSDDRVYKNFRVLDNHRGNEDHHNKDEDRLVEHSKYMPTTNFKPLIPYGQRLH